ncbi:glycosyltransferase [Streptococcus uberis]
MKNKENVMAGIVSFNPDIDRLILNIDAILSQVNKVVLVDNSSNNIREIESKLEKKYQNSIELIENPSNLGIGNALNKIFQIADNLSYDWVVTLDQDTVVPDRLVDTYFKYYDMKSVGQISSNILEKSTNKTIYKSNKTFTEVTRCITSGSMSNVSAWKLSGGYDEELFIDYVDYDFSMKISKNNYKIIRCNDITIEHELGDSVTKFLLFIPIRVPNYSPFRKFYISRNIIIYIRRYFSFKILILESLRLLKVIIYTMFENDKKNKYISILTGIKKGIKYSK